MFIKSTLGRQTTALTLRTNSTIVHYNRTLVFNSIEQHWKWNFKWAFYDFYPPWPQNTILKCPQLLYARACNPVWNQYCPIHSWFEYAANKIFCFVSFPWRFFWDRSLVSCSRFWILRILTLLVEYEQWLVALCLAAGAARVNHKKVVEVGGFVAAVELVAGSRQHQLYCLQQAACHT